VRDAARIRLGTPGVLRGEDPIVATLDVFVFNRGVRARAWSELEAAAREVRHPVTGERLVRSSGPDDADATWLLEPPGGGVATVTGHRATVGFALQITFQRAGATRPEDALDLTARAERAARTTATDWTTWLAQQPGVGT
jgi:hypothetical protein